ncbi:biopolymer transporter ExbB [Candidatus Endobugula sertula]|uniref:Biopolymer transporter ExbB n=1 Tax=Candidatus Endobugula sertula TaxID=62101 RepID=A0A1D2QTU6_9GAMM|nr:biopolymer transporter ExbB [Candidatus Endobugula sertula]
MKNHNSDGMNPHWVVSSVVLIVCFTVIHLLFEGVIRPNAETVLANSGTVSTLNVFVILKDLEQQLCISAAAYCLFLMGYKLIALVGEEDFYTRDFLQGSHSDNGFDIDTALNTLESSKYKDNSAIATWINCLRRYKNTHNVQHASDAIVASVETLAMQLESGNNMIRYIIWAIPSIGFVGTVRGIGQALAQADEALAGNITGMTSSLGVAFNSTFVALLLSLLLMFLLHILQSRQDQMVINTQRGCEKNLLTHLHQ